MLPADFEIAGCDFYLHASIVYQFHSIDILQSLLICIAILSIVELAAAAAAVSVAVVDAAAIDMVEEDISIVEKENAMHGW